MTVEGAADDVTEGAGVGKKTEVRHSEVGAAEVTSRYPEAGGGGGETAMDAAALSGSNMESLEAPLMDRG